MVKTNCLNCPNHCCGHQSLRPILLPEESMQYPDNQVEILTTISGQITTFAKNSNGNCVFFEGGRCTNYENRPLECRLYPYLLDFSGSQPDIKLDNNCPEVASITCDVNTIKHQVHQIEFNNEWINIYNSLSGV